MHRRTALSYHCGWCHEATSRNAARPNGAPTVSPDSVGSSCWAAYAQPRYTAALQIPHGGPALVRETCLAVAHGELTRQLRAAGTTWASARAAAG